MRSFFHLTEQTPSTIDVSTGLSTTSLLQIHDFKGSNQTYAVASPSAKVSIFNSSSITLNISSRVLTSSLELFSSSDINLNISCLINVIQLDPPLENVLITFSDPTKIGILIVTASGDDLKKGIKNLRLEVAGEGETESTTTFLQITDQNRLVLIKGDEKTPTQSAPSRDGEQWTISFDMDGQKWKAKKLEREEKEYPVLATV